MNLHSSMDRLKHTKMKIIKVGNLDLHSSMDRLKQ